VISSDNRGIKYLAGKIIFPEAKNAKENIWADEGWN
jgi:hypothetical protein